MKLMEPYLDQGYHLYLNNFYTSSELVTDLFLHGAPSAGTIKLNRKGFPACLENAQAWTRTEKRGDVRWVRNSPVWHCNRLTVNLFQFFQQSMQGR